MHPLLYKPSPFILTILLSPLKPCTPIPHTLPSPTHISPYILLSHLLFSSPHLPLYLFLFVPSCIFLYTSTYTHIPHCYPETHLFPLLNFSLHLLLLTPACTLSYIPSPSGFTLSTFFFPQPIYPYSTHSSLPFLLPLYLISLFLLVSLLNTLFFSTLTYIPFITAFLQPLQPPCSPLHYQFYIQIPHFNLVFHFSNFPKYQFLLYRYHNDAFASL